MLLIVGAASRSYIGAHKALTEFSESDFDLLVAFTELGFSRIIVLPHILTEVSNLASQTYRIARQRVRDVLAEFIACTEEQPVPSRGAVERDAFITFGLTDAVILIACEQDEERITLLTDDRDLAVAAEIASALGDAAGLQVVFFGDLRD